VLEWVAFLMGIGFRTSDISKFSRLLQRKNRICSLLWLMKVIEKCDKP